MAASLILVPDGLLYISTGEADIKRRRGSSHATSEGCWARSCASIRCLKRRHALYGIPASNPFVGEPGRDEIFAYGLRNPWRFSFDGNRI